jgi:hypothetical protein
MASWEQFTREAPDLAGRVHARFTANVHHVLATVRPDGAPRLSGIEVHFHAADVWLGSMPNSAKGGDLARDPRFALHSAPLEKDLANGDATLTGAVEQVDDLAVWQAITAHLEGPPPEQLQGDLYRLDLDAVSLVHVKAGRLVTEKWRPGSEPTRRERT